MSCQYSVNNDEWGFYVDIEKTYDSPPIKKRPPIYLYDDACLNIYEYDEYVYDEYKNIYDGSEDYDSRKINIDNKKVTYMLIKVTSTTFITIILTYIIMYALL